MKSRFLTTGGIFVFLFVLPSMTSFGASTITIESSTSTGGVMWGAIGWLYGLGIQSPNDSMITGLGHPQVTCQNAPNGLQHPDGYADRVAPQFKRCGGKRVDIYCQDIYAGWPYPNRGIDDYLAKLDTIARTIVADPNRSFYSYSIFNEPNDIWYSASGTGLTNLCNDWKRCFDKIRSIDSTAKFTGPGFSRYNSSAYRTFFTFCRDNNCLPDYVSWHELFDSFFTDWYNNYNDFRKIETDLGIGKHEIVINEYGRSTATSSYSDLSVPGNLVQFISRFETSKVYACLAFWTGMGTLNDLVANSNSNQQVVGTSLNQPDGAWYLYQWYGQMSGNTVAVTLPSQTGSLQALASKDGDNLTILFGGSAGLDDVFDVNAVVKGLSGTAANYTVHETNYTGTSAAGAPTTKSTGTASVSGGQITISVTGCKARSAYKIAVTTNSGATPAPTSVPGTRGDVNNSGSVDIVDALLIAQYYVGLNPSGFVSANADTNCSGSIDIVDALLVAQQYVGLITSFPC
jgi:hypothetical protein